MSEILTIDHQEIEYELKKRGNNLAVFFHGGHMRADLWLGEDVFVENDWSVLQPSRPGYGATPLEAGPSPAEFVDRIAKLVSELGYTSVCAVGTSAGGRSAMTFAANYPELVTNLILESSVSFEEWPDRKTRRVARAAFNSYVEPITWGIAHQLFRIAPNGMLRAMMGSLSTLPPKSVVEDFSEEERKKLNSLFKQMRSGSGFSNDLIPSEDITSNIVQPTLIIASKNDGAVALNHAESLQRSIASSKLELVDTLSHFLWVGSNAIQEKRIVADFLKIK